MNNSTTNRILRYIINIVLFLTPFIFLIAPSDTTVSNPNHYIFFSNLFFFPFISTKAFIFRTLVEIAFTLWLILILRDRKYAPRFSVLSLSVTVFTIITLIADLFGVNPLRSIWSNFERMEGWLTIIHLWAYYIVISGVFGSYSSYISSKNNPNKYSNEDTMRMWYKFININLFVALFIAIYGLFQLNGYAQIHQGGVRLDASLGNAIYLAVYMLFQTFFSIYMFFVALSKKIKNYSYLIWIYLALALLYAYILFQTATRGTILALIGGIMLALFIYGVFGKGESEKKRWISISFIGFIILIGLVFWMNRDSSFVRKSQSLNRLASISISDTKTQARGFIWPMAIKGSFESPKTAIIGWGQENFNYIFNKNYDPGMWRHEQWFDRAHNVYLDWLVAGGILGLISYLLLYVLSLIFIWKSNLDIKSKSILIGLVVGYAIHNIFVFDNLASYFLFFSLLAFIHCLRESRAINILSVGDNRTEDQIVVRDYVYVPVIVILSLITLYFIIIKPVKSNISLTMALSACPIKNSQNQPTTYYSNALKLNQYIANQEIREQLITCAANIIKGDYSTESKTNFYLLAKQEIENQIKATPNDARIYVLGAVFFDGIGDWKSGLTLIQKAYEISPNKQTTAFELIENYINTGKEKEALEIAKKTFELAIDNRTSKILYTVALILNGQENKAHELFDKDDADIFSESSIINTYVKVKNYLKVIDIYKKLIVKEPDNIQYHSSLVTAYLYSGNEYMAISELKTMKEKFPQITAEIDGAIKQIREGKINLQK